MENAEMIYNPDDDPRSEVQTAFEEKYLDLEGVLGVGITTGPTGDDAIVVYLEHGGAESKLPKTFQGLDVIAEIVGEVKALDLPPD